MKRFLLVLPFFAAVLLASAPARAQASVPTHEFFVEGSAALGPLVFRSEEKTSSLGPSYGGGLGYTWHITPMLGVTTGGQVLFSNSGIKTDNHNEDLTDVSVLVPLMLQVMIPMQSNGHCFYAALGGKAGFLLHSVSRTSGEDLQEGEGGLYDTFHLKRENPQKRFFPMAAAETGFRWALKGGCGLYTGFFADYGFPVQDSRAFSAGITLKFAFGKAQ